MGTAIKHPVPDRVSAG